MKKWYRLMCFQFHRMLRVTGWVLLAVSFLELFCVLFWGFPTINETPTFWDFLFSNYISLLFWVALLCETFCLNLIASCYKKQTKSIYQLKTLGLRRAGLLFSFLVPAQLCICLLYVWQATINSILYHFYCKAIASYNAAYGEWAIPVIEDGFALDFFNTSFQLFFHPLTFFITIFFISVFFWWQFERSVR